MPVHPNIPNRFCPAKNRPLNDFTTHECHYSNECQCACTHALWCVLKIVLLKNFDVVHIIIIVVPGHTTELVQPGINRVGGGGGGGGAQGKLPPQTDEAFPTIRQPQFPPR